MCVDSENGRMRCCLCLCDTPECTVLTDIGRKLNASNHTTRMLFVLDFLICYMIELIGICLILRLMLIIVFVNEWLCCFNGFVSQ